MALELFECENGCGYEHKDIALVEAHEKECTFKIEDDKTYNLLNSTISKLRERNNHHVYFTGVLPPGSNVEDILSNINDGDESDETDDEEEEGETFASRKRIIENVKCLDHAALLTNGSFNTVSNRNSEENATLFFCKELMACVECIVNGRKVFEDGEEEEEEEEED